MAEITKTDVNMQELEEWCRDTETELTEVKSLLDKFAKVLDKSDDDTISSICQKIGQGMADAYIKLSDVFTKTVDKTKEMLNDWKKGFQNMGEKITNFVQNFHL